MIAPPHPIIGGTETVVKNLAIKLNEIGISTDVITFNMDKKWIIVYRPVILPVYE